METIIYSGDSAPKYKLIKRFYDKYLALRTRNKVPFPMQDCVRGSIDSLRSLVEAQEALVVAATEAEDQDAYNTIQNQTHEVTAYKIAREETGSRFTQRELEEDLWFLFTNVVRFIP